MSEGGWRMLSTNGTRRNSNRIAVAVDFLCSSNQRDAARFSKFKLA
jgi:hypothetical protein